MKLQIETERLILRELRLTDLEGMFELDSNPEVHKYLGNKPVKTKAESKKILKNVINQYKGRGIGRFAAIEKSSGDFIGWTGLKFNTGDKEAIGKKRDFYDIGYRFIQRYWGKGYASESSFKMLDFGFNKLHLKTIVGAAETENLASNKVLKKIGLQLKETFPFEGVKVNWYELNKEDYE